VTETVSVTVSPAPTVTCFGRDDRFVRADANRRGPSLPPSFLRVTETFTESPAAISAALPVRRP